MAKQTRMEAGYQVGLKPEDRPAGALVHRILERLYDWAATEWKPSEDPGRGVPWLDPPRENRVLLLDGDRGTGKTTALLTVLEELRRRALLRRDSGAGEKPFLTEEKNWPQGEKTLIYPLAPINLHTLAENSPITMLVFARLCEVLIHPLGYQEVEDPAWWQGTGIAKKAGKEPDPARLLQRRDQVTEALSARSLSQVNPGRRDQDPEQFLAELSGETMHAVDLERRFRLFVDELIRALEHHYDAKVMILLSLDDTDMHPALAVQVLRSLYLFYHPRLAFLTTGHTDLFRSRLEAGILSWWGMGAADHRTLRDLNALEVASRLAATYYERVVPPTHRLQMAEEPLDFLNNPVDRTGRTVVQLLKEIPLPSGGFLLDLVAPTLPEDPTSYHRHRSLLPTRRREQEDVKLQLLQLRDLVDQPHSDNDGLVAGLRRFARSLWAAAVHESGAPSWARRSLAQAVPDEGVLRVVTRIIRWDPCFRAVGHVDVKEGRLRLYNNRAGYAYLEEGTERWVLPRRVVATWQFLCDLASDGRIGMYAGEPPAATLFNRLFVTRQEVEGEVVELSWPLPVWEGFLPYQRMRWFIERNLNTVALDRELFTTLYCRAVAAGFGWTLGDQPYLELLKQLPKGHPFHARFILVAHEALLADSNLWDAASSQSVEPEHLRQALRRALVDWSEQGGGSFARAMEIYRALDPQEREKEQQRKADEQFRAAMQGFREKSQIRSAVREGLQSVRPQLRPGVSTDSVAPAQPSVPAPADPAAPPPNEPPANAETLLHVLRQIPIHHGKAFTRGKPTSLGAYLETADAQEWMQQLDAGDFRYLLRIIGDEREASGLVQKFKAHLHVSDVSWATPLTTPREALMWLVVANHAADSEETPPKWAPGGWFPDVPFSFLAPYDRSLMARANGVLLSEIQKFQYLLLIFLYRDPDLLEEFLKSSSGKSDSSQRSTGNKVLEGLPGDWMGLIGLTLTERKEGYQGPRWKSFKRFQQDVWGLLHRAPPREAKFVLLSLKPTPAKLAHLKTGSGKSPLNMYIEGTLKPETPV